MSSYSRMIVIPQEEYVQMTAMQQMRQPLADQVYKTERDYEQNLQIKDPHRAVMLQSETIERLKALKDQMRHYLSISTPRPYRSRAESLFQSLEPYLNVNEKGEIIKEDQSVIDASRYEDLIQHAVRDRRRNFVPVGWDYFVQLMKKYNVPKASLNRETLDELQAPIQPSPTKLRTPKRWIKQSPKAMTPKPMKESPKSFPQEFVKQSPEEITQRRARSKSRRAKAPPQKFMFSEY